MQLVSIGDNCVDVYADHDAVTAGGNALNVAARWAQSGAVATYVGAVGDDPAASIILSALREAGVSVDSIEQKPGDTGLTVLRLRDQDREFVAEDYGVSAGWSPSAMQLRSAEQAAWIHLAGPLLRNGIPRSLQKAGSRISVDLSTSTGLSDLTGVEVAFLSWNGPRDEAARQRAERARRAGASLVVVLCGPNGSLALDNFGFFEADAQPITPVDTCGAGDSFIAAFVESRLRDLSTAAGLRHATLAATATCLCLGGFPQPKHPIPATVRARVALMQAGSRATR